MACRPGWPQAAAALLVVTYLALTTLQPTTAAAADPPPADADVALVHPAAADEAAALGVSVASLHTTGVCATLCPLLAGCFSCPRLVSQGCSRCISPNYSKIGRGCGKQMKK